MMKKLFFFLIALLCFSLVAHAQYNTTPTDTDPAHILSDGDYEAWFPSHYYAEDKHFLGQVIPSTNFLDGFLTVYNENLILETAVEIPNYNGPPSQQHSSAIIDERMGYQNGSLYFMAAVDNDEHCLYRYDINQEEIIESTRLSLYKPNLSYGRFENMHAENGKVFVLIMGSDPNVKVSTAANWSNSIINYDNSVGGYQDFLIMLDEDMSNPVLLHHFKPISEDLFPAQKEMSLLDNGNLLVPFEKESVLGGVGYDDSVFVEIDITTGDIVRSISFDGRASMVEDPETGNFIVSRPSFNYVPAGGGSHQVIERDFLLLLNSNWEEIYNTGRITDNGNYTYDVIVTEDSYIAVCGFRSLEFSGLSNIAQSWMYIHMDKNFQRKVIYAGEQVERKPEIVNRPRGLKKYGLDEDGYNAIFFYSDEPRWAPDYSLVSIGGVQLPEVGIYEYKTVAYHRNTSVPQATFTPQLGTQGVNVFVNKKIVDNNLVDDPFSAVLVLENGVDISSWVDTVIDPSYIGGGEPSGWSVWADYSQYGIGNVQYNETENTYFVDVAIYDYSDPLGFHIARAITNTKFQRIYLINDEELSVDDFENNIIAIYPNPTKDILQIQIDNTLSFNSASIFSIQGKKLLETNLKSVNLSTLAQGVYFLNVETSKGTITKKIIKQ